MWNSKLTGSDQKADHSSETSERSPEFIIPTKNLVLASLPQVDANHIIAAAKPVQLNVNDVLYEAGDEIDYVYFPISCVVSALSILEDGSSVENYMTGREGLVGIPALIGGRKALHWTRVSAPGGALRLFPNVLQDLSIRSEATHHAVLRAYRHLFTQICAKSVCNTRHSLIQRLSVWLLMMSDRVNSDRLPFTQEEIANRISVRRAGVSVAASMLQALHGISYHRGRIVITDRDVLVRMACECYQTLSQDFEDDLRGGGK
jgi:CRP-like cAMP-binding protein